MIKAKKNFGIKNLRKFLKTLSSCDHTRFDSYDVTLIDEFLGSDECTGVVDVYSECCVIHDFWYRSNVDFDLNPITRAQADARFRRCMQKHSLFGIMSPLSWWRWAGVRLFGGKAWNC